MKGAGIEQRSAVSDDEEEVRGPVTLQKTFSRASFFDISRVEAEEEAEAEAEQEDEEEDEDEAKDGVGELFAPGPLCSLKDTLERDKEDESLQRWKKQLLGFADNELIGDTVEPEVKMVSLGLMCKGQTEISVQLPVEKTNNVCFTLIEGSIYRMKFTFMVQNNIVCGLAFTNSIWKGGIQVDRSQGMLGTFSPQREPYIYVTEEETTPKGVLARGFYTAKTKFVDDDGRCHLELHYPFEIQKDWKDKNLRGLNKGSENNKVYMKQWLVRNFSHQFTSKSKKEKNHST